MIGGISPSDKTGRPFSSILIGVQEGGASSCLQGPRSGSFAADTLEKLAEAMAAASARRRPSRVCPGEASRGAQGRDAVVSVVQGRPSARSSPRKDLSGTGRSVKGPIPETDNVTVPVRTWC